MKFAREFGRGEARSSGLRGSEALLAMSQDVPLAVPGAAETPPVQVRWAKFGDDAS